MYEKKACRQECKISTSKKNTLYALRKKNNREHVKHFKNVYYILTLYLLYTYRVRTHFQGRPTTETPSVRADDREFQFLP